MTNPEDALLELATSPAERTFAIEALEFLGSRVERRQPIATAWGEGPEDLALFHETTDAEERVEVEAAREWQRSKWDAGFGWITGPQEHDGRGLPSSYDTLFRLLEAEFATVDMNSLRVGLSTVGPALVRFANKDLVERYAAGFQRGDVVACQLFSEPDAGSDLAAVRTRASRSGDDWIVTGQKVWTSNATFADVGLALVRTDPQAARHRGLTMFVVPMDAEGVEVRPLRQMTGGASFSEVFLSDVRLSDDMRVGDAGSGWEVAVGAVAGERRAVGDRFHETTARAMRLLRALMGSAGLDREPTVVAQWVDIHAQLQLARLQQLRMQAVPESQRNGSERAIDKILLASNLRLIGELAAQILGPSFVADTGAWGTFNWNKWLMGALGYRIAGGTEEILKTMLAERMLGLPRGAR